jgi:hypothetical protein
MKEAVFFTDEMALARAEVASVGGRMVHVLTRARLTKTAVGAISRSRRRSLAEAAYRPLTGNRDPETSEGGTNEGSGFGAPSAGVMVRNDPRV